MTRRTTLYPSIETLEARIAPAVLMSPSVSSDGRTATWTDVDGDLVTLKITKGKLALGDGGNFDFQETEFGYQLQELDLSSEDYKGTNVTFTAKRHSELGGDNLVNVGAINAAGQPLGAVSVSGDLASITAGLEVLDAKSPFAVKSLKVGSMGMFGDTTLDEDTGNLRSELSGKVGPISVKGSMRGITMEVSGETYGSIASLTIGESLIGTADSDSGRIVTSGTIGAVKIKGDVMGGDGQRSGSIEAGANVKSIAIGGSIYGGKSATPENEGSGVISVEGSVRSLTVGGSIFGGTQQASGLISATGDILTLKVSGNLVGGTAGMNNGTIFVGGNSNSLQILGSVIGGAADDSGMITVDGTVKSLVVKQMLRGGAGEHSGSITLGTDVNDKASITIGGDILGGTGEGSGRVSAQTVNALTVSGGLYGGTANESGSIAVAGLLGSGKIVGHIVGGDLAADATEDLVDSGSIVIGRANKLDVGAIRTGVDYNTTVGIDLVNSAAIRAADSIAALTVRGGIEGMGETRALITARGQISVPVNSRADVAFGSVTVKGSVTNTDILAGYNTVLDVAAAGANPDAHINTVNVTGSWIASNLVAGAAYNETFGDGTDTLIDAVGSDDIYGTINSIKIGGAVMGTAGDADDHFGFVTQRIFKMQVGSPAITIVSNNLTGNDNSLTSPLLNLGPTLDTRVYELTRF